MTWNPKSGWKNIWAHPGPMQKLPFTKEESTSGPTLNSSTMMKSLASFTSASLATACSNLSADSQFSSKTKTQKSSHNDFNWPNNVKNKLTSQSNSKNTLNLLMKKLLPQCHNLWPQTWSRTIHHIQCSHHCWKKSNPFTKITKRNFYFTIKQTKCFWQNQFQVWVNSNLSPLLNTKDTRISQTQELSLKLITSPQSQNNSNVRNKCSKRELKSSTSINFWAQFLTTAQLTCWRLSSNDWTRNPSIQKKTGKSSGGLILSAKSNIFWKKTTDFLSLKKKLTNLTIWKKSSSSLTFSSTPLSGKKLLVRASKATLALSSLSCLQNPMNTTGSDPVLCWSYKWT